MYYLYILSALGLSATGLRLEAWQVASTNGENESSTLLTKPDEIAIPSQEEMDAILAEIFEEVESAEKADFEFAWEEAENSTTNHTVDGSEITPEMVDQILAEIDKDDDIGLEVDWDWEEDGEQNDTACTFSTVATSLPEWLADLRNFDHSSCKDFGPRFGAWGKSACGSLPSIISDVLAESKEASGGKSGTKPLVSSRYVVKLMDEIEHNMLNKLLRELRGSRRLTLLAPTCRSLAFQVGSTTHYVQIAANLAMRGAQEELYSRIFDLKGNHLWKYRKADSKNDFVMKDVDFKATFPKGINISQVMLPGKHLSQDSYVGEEAADFFARTLYTDGKLLARLGLMDYSLLVHVTSVTGRSGLTALNTDKPTAYAVIRTGGEDELFLLSFGIIDLLMHESENRGFMNKLAFTMTLSECRVTELDPIPAFPYWIRFCRMFGMRMAYSNSKGTCTSCLHERRSQSYTYFPSAWALKHAQEHHSCNASRGR
ncbi:unnamed protein product [Effrenium voratum]|nr:unnamed protein product [Effrenium voratum]